MGTCRAAHVGGAAYWVVATNRDTEHYVCWPVRDSLEAAISDVRATCENIPPDEFERLKKDDEVTFLIARAYPHARETFVWAWRWDPAGPPRRTSRTEPALVAS